MDRTRTEKYATLSHRLMQRRYSAWGRKLEDFCMGIVWGLYSTPLMLFCWEGENQKFMWEVCGDQPHGSPRNFFALGSVDIVGDWCKKMGKLAEIAKSQSHAAYAAYIHGEQHKYTYFL